MKVIYIDSNSYKKIYFLNKFFYRIYYNNKYNFLYNLISFYKLKKKLFTSSQKNRSLVNFSKRKIYKQKGTGRSRAGSLSSPLRVGGGRTFPNKFFKKKFYKINKKKYNICLKLLLFNFIKYNKIYILEDFFLLKPSCFLILNFLNYLNLNKKFLLILTNNINSNFFFSCKNLFRIKINSFRNLNLLLLIKFSLILIFRSSLNYI